VKRKEELGKKEGEEGEGEMNRTNRKNELENCQVLGFFFFHKGKKKLRRMRIMAGASVGERYYAVLWHGIIFGIGRNWEVDE